MVEGRQEGWGKWEDGRGKKEWRGGEGEEMKRGREEREDNTPPISEVERPVPRPDSHENVHVLFLQYHVADHHLNLLDRHSLRHTQVPDVRQKPAQRTIT